MTPLLAPRPRTDRAFERMYQRHVGDVYRYALAVMRNPADAEDVTQTTFLNAYRSFVEKGNRPEKPQNWLIAIAHNVCRQRFRQSARRPSEVAFDDDIADTLVDDETPTGEDIRRALGHLAFNQRAALVMRELEGRSYAEIAQILEVSTSAVETLIFRARRALREQMEGSLTCGEAEFAISRQLDGRLPRQERGQLRAHLRECSECSAFARRQRAQRGAIKSLALVPIPGSLGSFFGGGGAAVGSGLALKGAAAVTAGLLIGGAGMATAKHALRTSHPTAASAAPALRSSSPHTAVRASSEHTTVGGGSKPVANGRSAPARAPRLDRAAKARGKSAQAHSRHGRALGRQKHLIVTPRITHLTHVHPVHPVHPVAHSHGRSAPKTKRLKLKPLRASGGHGSGNK
jgi:RNA polymerase sigma factor (sigma-70 family)